MVGVGVGVKGSQIQANLLQNQCCWAEEAEVADWCFAQSQRDH